MSIGNWSPDSSNSSTEFNLTNTLLKRFLSTHSPDGPADLTTQLSQDEITQLAPIMTATAESWFKATEAFTNQEIENLMRVFTLAEQLPGWEAGDQSPVIWLGKVLKKRGCGIDKSLTLWIKNHSDNRFLPHGSLL